MRIAISGASGLIGGALSERLVEDGHHVLELRRGAPEDPTAHWSPEAGWVRPGTLAGFDALVNLSGASIGDGRWTPERMAELRFSRIASTRVLVEHLATLPADDRPSVLVNQSAVGYYGERGDEELTEDAAPGAGFLAEMVIDWEFEALAAEDLGVRVVLHRSAIVLSKDGPPLSRMLLPFRLGLGGPIGTGRWWMPWITLEDEVRSLEHVLARAELSGPVNAAAPCEVRNIELTRALGRRLRRPTLAPLPWTAYRLAFGQDPSQLFTSQRVVPRALAESGFTFAHPDIDGALEAILS